jgi:hypothetical protein
MAHACLVSQRASSVETSVDIATLTHLDMQFNAQQYLLYDVELYNYAASKCRYPPLSFPLTDETTLVLLESTGAPIPRSSRSEL